MKRILMMIPTPPPFMGPSVATEIILKSNLKKYFDLILIDTADRRELSNLGKFDILNLFHFLRQFFLLLFKNLFLKIDLNYLLLTQTRLGILRDFLFFLLLRFLRKRILFHFRGSGIFKLYGESNIFFKFLIEKMMNNSDGVIFLCEKLKEEAERRFPGGRFFSVSNGLNIPEVIREGEMRCRNILFLSNLKESKGFYDVLKIIGDVVEEFRDVKFIFGGEFLFDENRVKDIFSKFKDNVELHKSPTGEIKEKLFCKSHLFLLPSYNEGMPWAIIEAMGHSLPIISTKVGCIPEMVLNGENGFLIEPGDIDSLKKSIFKFLDGSIDFIKCGKISREIYERNFKEENFISGLKNVFEEILK